MNIMVVGGAGYIGSHMVLQLSEAGHQVFVLDDLSSGHRDAMLYGDLIEGNVGDSRLLGKLFKKRRPDAVMHFASFIQVGESVRQPAKYYRNNVINTVNLLDAMVEHDIDKFVFSSTAAIFSETDRLIREDHPKAPINPYGRSKLMIEDILEDYDRAYGLKYCCLRYFNAAGADPEGRIGERHEPESHLIPLVLQVASGRRSHIDIFGRDYPTHDGTCVRDYIHVCDLCSAHLAALERLGESTRSLTYNLGNGGGYSVQEVIATAEQVTGKKIAVRDVARRAGDSARLVADAELARKELGWEPRYPNLADIILHAWNWEKKVANAPRTSM